jgi:hypothetical protein
LAQKGFADRGFYGDFSCAYIGLYGRHELVEKLVARLTVFDSYIRQKSRLGGIYVREVYNLALGEEGFQLGYLGF